MLSYDSLLDCERYLWTRCECQIEKTRCECPGLCVTDWSGLRWKTKLTREVEIYIYKIAIQYSKLHMNTTEVAVKEELEANGHILSTSTVHWYVKRLGGHITTLHLKPSLSTE